MTDGPAPPLGVAGGDDASAVDTTPGRQRHGRRRLLLEWTLAALAALVLAWAARVFFFQAFYVPSGSMEPTLKIGDRILVDKLLFNPAALKTGDIVVFVRPPDVTCGDDEADFVKRVIGVPGDRLSSVGNTVYVNGRPLAEPYLPPGQALGPPVRLPGDDSVVPPGEYFVMGDNRPDSCDSRYWGYVSASAILGKVVLTWWADGHPAFHPF